MREKEKKQACLYSIQGELLVITAACVQPKINTQSS